MHLSLNPLPLLLIIAPAIVMAVPVNVALNQYAEADSISSAAYVAPNTVDGDTTSDASRWLSSGDAMPHWIEVDLGQHYVLSEMKFWTGKQDVGPFPLRDFALQY